VYWKWFAADMMKTRKRGEKVDLGFDAAGKELVPILDAAVQHKDLPVRLSAAVVHLVAGRDIETVCPVLVAGLGVYGSRTHGLRELAAEALEMAGPRAAPALIQGLRELRTDGVDHWSMNANAHRVLAKIGRDAVPALVEALGDAEPDQDWRIIQVLKDIGPEAAEAVPALIEAIRCFGERESAMEALGEIGPSAQAAVPLLEGFLEHPEGNVQVAAATALWKITGQEDKVVAVLCRNLNYFCPDVRRDAAHSLGCIGFTTKEVLAVLVRALEEDEADGRLAAAEALGEMGPAAKPALPALRKRLRGEANMCIAAAAAIWEITGEADEALPGFVHALVAPEWSCRMRAAEALGRMGHAAKEAIPALEKTTEDQSESVRQAAEKALKTVKGISD